MKSSQWTDLKEYLESNRRLVVAVVIALIGIASLQAFIGQANLECLGVADSKETTVAFESPVVIKRIFILPGQVVRKGQPLVEVEPVELNMKLLELTTQLESLRSEKKVRDSLMKSFGKTSSGVSPIEQEILGLQAQVDEMRKQQAQAVRYAEEDGVVATVNFRPREQVAPFTPVISLSSNVPNTVYGFIHENRLAEFRVGDRVMVESLSAANLRTATGKVVALGNRITAFPERMQTPGQARPTYFGRELVIALPNDNQIMMGEKVRIRADKIQFSELNFQAYADENGGLPSVKLAEALDIETSGMVYLQDTKSLLVGSDDDGPNDSPFWMVPIADPTKAVNLPMVGLSQMDDVESMSQSNGKIYAMSSLSRSKKDKVKFERNIVARLALAGGQVKVDRALDLRTPLLANLQTQPLLRGLWAELDSYLEVEGFSMDGSDAYLALKEPRFPDGTSIILKLRGLAQQIEAGRIDRLDLDVLTMVKLDSRLCDEPSKITDLIKTKGGLAILSNCRRSEKTGQVWFLADNAPPQQVELLTALKHGRPEAMAFGDDMKSLFVGSDNGKKKGSDLIKVQIPNIQ